MKKVEIYEVGPRDGFQNIKEYIPLETKLEIVDGLVQAGIRHIEVTSFVSPKAIPQLKDSLELSRRCLDQYPDVDFIALIPNLRGAQAAVQAGIKRIAYVVSLSASHNKANINRTHEQSYAALQEIMTAYPQLDIILDLATTFGCPFEGKVPASRVVEFLEEYITLGVKQVCLCDTIGIANPAQVRDSIAALRTAYPQLELQVHIHDTRNMGAACTLAAIEAGVTKIQSTLGGLGGCPFAPGASGNLATEDMIYMLNEMGYDTNINFERILNLAKEEVKRIPAGVYSGHHIHVDATSQCFR
ncbi:hydroxymethylglutaryl-CoA lyase [Megasphaera cerevisiae DSM 20462]|jgi:hydroxymethylglutaryl-CoA lyase|uniref:Hydroxymethylglutaryl-CoA lyase n=1 Tax=Megasphaera cerevisiae DSM 20462 TaxID=1122219 RepID=A0A0J6WXF9_9FIRM|nr:hydroxymethylglutaryl-CoA lyase [Megasphaera cerevisiae]KMO87314.1 hydroxymethylglutaryl-CoA lyase [Megasphaera cerevisiae DSM 20462]OKY54574.1 hydroxymethylglutaryl-CoA lyase [Megasphaera cerevisiae]SJZ47931.1 hydroxymethylglutaryl-CoA lyase [Megasphaera cerevisiae DSM 20462]